MRALVTGAGGLIGSESAKFLLGKGYSVDGIDNNMRRVFFGEKGDTSGNIDFLERNYDQFKNHDLDIRDKGDVNSIFHSRGPFDIVIHTAAQPSHDWAARDVLLDFGVNVTGTLNLLEGLRQYSQEATFIFTSTNKVYGDSPNDIPLRETQTRWDYDLDGDFQRTELRRGVSEEGINERLTIDQSTHSFFGAGKLAADIYVQEFGRRGLKTGIFRGGCLTGPQHSAVELHGFLSYIVDCAMTGKEYTIFGYKAKQVRDQIHSTDVANAFWNFHQNPQSGEVYNLGGGRENAASMTEIINILDQDFGLKLNHTYSEENRLGDHICYYSDLSKLRSHYPNWRITKSLHQIIDEIVKAKK